MTDSDHKRYRRYIRRALDVEIQVRDAGDVGGEIFFDAVDISEGGAFVRSSFLLEIGERLEASFRLPKQQNAIVVRCIVAWVTPHANLKGEAGFGLEFIDLTDEEKEQISAFVHANQLPLQESEQKP